jgi:hypothetical protein
MNIGETCHTNYKKRRYNLINGLKDGIIAPSKMSLDVLPLNGSISFKVPSNKNSSYFPTKIEIYHIVTININKPSLYQIDKNIAIPGYVDSKEYNVLSNDDDDEYITYTCTCENKMDTFGVCKHIKAVIIYMSTDLIKKQEHTDENIELIGSLNNVFNKCLITH